MRCTVSHQRGINLVSTRLVKSSKSWVVIVKSQFIIDVKLTITVSKTYVLVKL